MTNQSGAGGTFTADLEHFVHAGAEPTTAVSTAVHHIAAQAPTLAAEEAPVN